MKTRQSIVSIALVVASIVFVAGAWAKTLQTWDKQISKSSRFKLVLEDQAVLDNETGLVWQRFLDPVPTIWADAVVDCYVDVVAGGRAGFRLPTVDELMTVLDLSVGTPLKLTPGHPFDPVDVSDSYWSATTSTLNTADALAVRLLGVVQPRPKTVTHLKWCVRGPGAVE